MTGTPYGTAKPLLGALPQWLNAVDATRLAAYDLYENMYANTPDTFTLMLRGSEERPIYVPSARQIINTMGRYTARGWGFTVDPAAGQTAAQEEAIIAYGDLFNRERFLSQFASNKRLGLIRGDWCWLILGNPLKPEGRRISLRALDPALVFWQLDPNDSQIKTGVDVVEQITLSDGKQYLRRQRWLRGTHPMHPNYNETAPSYDAPVAYESAVLELKDWETKPKAVSTSTPLTLLPPTITQLPIYHIRNNEDPEGLWGTSDLAGLERLIAGINQATSDQDVSLALAGLGMYETDGGAPVDEQGNIVDWDLGPGRVVEHATGTSFKKLPGVATVDPSLSHIKYLEQSMFRTTGISEVALGQIDTSTAESGIALALRMGPLLDAADEKDLEINAVMSQMLFDLKSWFAAYEGKNFDEVSVLSTVGEKLPVNRQQRFTELLEMLTNKIVDVQYVHTRLTKEFGYDIPADMLTRLESAAQASADLFGDRLADPDAEEQDDEEV